MRRSAWLLALVGLLAGCGGGSPHFQRADGWNVLSGQGALAAANVPFAASDRNLKSPPSATVATLPRGGVLIWAMVSRTAKRPESTPLPLRLSEGLPSNPFEGLGCAPAVSRSRCYAASGSVHRLVAQLRHFFVDLYVFFGTDRPAAASVTAANAELARLRFPREQSTAAAPACPARSGNGAYATTISPTSGPPGSTVTVSGPLPVIAEDGTYAGQIATRVDAYWNLDFRKWWTASTSSPLPSVPGSPVRHLGTQHVATLCGYRLRVTIPSYARGRYPIEVLYGDRHGSASFAPVDFEVTS